MFYYFAYGSNMNVERMIERQVKFTGYEKGTIENSTLRFSKKAFRLGEGFANIHYKIGEKVEGVLYELASKNEIKKLDRFEGCPFHYNRIEMLVKTKYGYKWAFVYIANNYFVDFRLKPSKKYLNHLLKGKEFLSKQYYNKLEVTKCI